MSVSAGAPAPVAPDEEALRTAVGSGRDLRTVELLDGSRYRVRNTLDRHTALPTRDTGTGEFRHYLGSGRRGDPLSQALRFFQRGIAAQKDL